MLTKKRKKYLCLATKQFLSVFVNKYVCMYVCMCMPVSKYSKYICV